MLIGFVPLTDPVRDAVPDAVQQAAARITVHVITGDNGRRQPRSPGPPRASAAQPPGRRDRHRIRAMDDAALAGVARQRLGDRLRASSRDKTCASPAGSRAPGTWSR